MLRIQQLKLSPDHSQEELVGAIRKSLRLAQNQPFSYEIIRRSIDARKRPEIFYVYTVDVDCRGEKTEKQLLKRAGNKNVSLIQPAKYRFPASGTEPLSLPPVIVGTGPAGLFCGLMLARAGYRPILLERGQSVPKRQKSVEQFWKTGKLNPDSNVQFGEGGAGTFSDGKLNTLVKDPEGRIRFVLQNFVQAGADAEILFSNKPHIGTDVLAGVVQNLRNEILSLGGQVFFHTRLDDFCALGNGIYRLSLQDTACDDPKDGFGDCSAWFLNTSVLVLAIGHSARDTFRMLADHQFDLRAKSFAVGVRVEHPQQLINDSQYGENCPYELEAAPYKVTHKLADGRGVYSFCMCPGGYVVNASSEPGMLAVNGMSYHDRAGENANSAIVVTVSPEDFGGCGPLDGLEFQRKLERNAYEAGQGRIPVQRFADFQANLPTREFGKVTPRMKGCFSPANVRQIFPERIGSAIEEGITAFERQIKGFSDPDTLISGVESRTSSPVRISRDAGYESSYPGIYPCGEGAGYAGGITSAAMDGIRVAEAIASKFSIDFLEK
ncbi:MAG: FAD-dependent oxidoreductase [Lachnospiraceae bacterium]|nr:FAD-dependent oxidoreductase [Lachnospiraceae bacterium]